ncbi:MAG: hypothetical protein DME22_15480 [Verrucomicrobia bacterium]|nr:MAG: hypothetical protein DME22_15480 [Verrucomicrobiota bacterium]
MKLKKNARLLYVPTAGPHKGKRCPATVTEVLGPALVNLEVRTAKGGHFVENVAKVLVVISRPKPGQASFPK